MPKRRSERAQRRIRERTARNALALETVAETEEDRPKLKQARSISQIEFFYGRGSNSDRQRAAGERLALDFRIAGGNPCLVARYEPRMTGFDKRQYARDLTPARIDARARFERALRAVGHQLAPLVVHVCICDLTVTDWSAPGIRSTDAPALLRLALSWTETSIAWRQRRATTGRGQSPGPMAAPPR